MSSTLLHISKIGHQLDGNLRRYKPIFDFQGYWRYRQWLKQQNTQIPRNQPLVIFDFKDSRIDGPQGRRFYCLFIYFIRAGYYPILRENYLFLGNIQEKQKAFCLHEKFSVLNNPQNLPDRYLLVTDKNFSILMLKADKIISVNFKPDYQPEDSCFPMPFPMFPAIYAHQQDQQLEPFRQTPRKWTIFFGGDAKTEKYDKSTIQEIYQKLTRSDIFILLKEKLAPHQLTLLKQQQDLDNAYKSQLNTLVLMNNRECKVPADKWLATLCLSEFFLACPGVRYPMSHNLIEAMAVGSIPITQYPELFYPALEDGKNCLVFKDEESLLSVIKRVLQMTREEKEKLKEGAVDYYEKYLAPEITIQRLLEHRPRKISLRLLPFLKDGGGFA
jgi:hypothetical protein